MIIKHIKRRSKGSPIGAGGFKRVIRYILREGVPGKAEGQGVRAYGIEGCVSDTESLQRKEMAAVIEQNQSAKGDRYYHVIVALQKGGETLSTEEWKKIADRLGEKIGFSAHQRVWAVHNDTEHEHLHVAFSKIHPERFTIHEPYRAYKKFGELIKECEAEFSLRSTPKQEGRRLRGRVGEEMEHHRGETSLLSWVHAEIGKELSVAIRGGQWQAVQDVVLQRGLEVRERGRGFVIADPATGTMAKFSDIARALSLRDQAKRLDGFIPRSFVPTPASTAAATHDIGYRWRPTSEEAGQLRQEYEKERQLQLETRQREISVLKKARDEEIAGERIRYREAVKAEQERMDLSERKQRRRGGSSLLRFLGVKVRLEHYYRTRRKDVYRRTRVRSWKQFLTERAMYDPLALRVLREHEVRRARTQDREHGTSPQGARRM